MFLEICPWIFGWHYHFVVFTFEKPKWYDMPFENLVFYLKVEGIGHTNHMINDKPKIGVKLPQST